MIRLLAPAASCTLLLIGVALLPAQSLELNAPGVSVGVGNSANGGVSATVGAGGASAGATIGSGGAEVSVGAGAGGAPGSVTDAIEAPAAEAAPLDDNGGLGTDAEIVAAFQSLASEEQAALRERCSRILDSPIFFTDALVTICRLIANAPR